MHNQSTYKIIIVILINSFKFKLSLMLCQYGVFNDQIITYNKDIFIIFIVFGTYKDHMVDFLAPFLGFEVLVVVVLEDIRSLPLASLDSCTLLMKVGDTLGI